MKMKFKLTEEKNVSKTSWIASDYKKLANLDESTVVAKEDIDSDVVNKVAARNYLDKEEVVEAILEEKETLTEAPTIGDSAE